MPASITPQAFVDKWSQIQLKETAASQSHFNDICRLIDHPTPVEYDPTDHIFIFKKRLKQRTLTNLYNGLVYFRESKLPDNLWSQVEFEKVTHKSVTRSEIQELDDIHQALDSAVFDAYGWAHDVSDEEILERLLALNLERAAIEAKEENEG